MTSTSSRCATTLCALALIVAPATLLGQPSGGADFGRYVAIGDSLGAGFASGSLVEDHQRSSYPALIFGVADGRRPFEQPLVSQPGIPPELELVGLNPPALVPKDGLGQPLNLTLPRPYDNLSVPGADVSDVLRTVTDGGGLHDLILRGLGTQLQQALSLQPTFVTLYIGQNDTLGAALSGIVIDGVTLTTLASFTADYTTVAGALALSGANLAFATLGDPTSIPFVTTIPPFVIDPATGEPLVIGGNFVPLIGPNGPLSAADNVLLTASSLLGQGIGIPAAIGGTGLPLPNEVVLDAGETARIVERTEQFNQVIRGVARQVGAVVVPVGEVIADAAENGMILGGIEFSTDFLTGGLFSYDGVHPTGLGYGLVANTFIEAINTAFGSSIPLVNLAPLAFGSGASVRFQGTPAEASRARYAPATYDLLRSQLGIPSYSELYVILAEGESGGDAVPGGPPPPEPPPAAPPGGDGEEDVRPARPR